MRRTDRGRELDRHAIEPLYQHLVTSISARIRRRDWAAGDQLPSERQLCGQFKVSRSTVRQALDLLTRAGLLERVQGRGTFVASHGPIAQPLDHVTAFREALAAQGIAPGLRLVEQMTVPCDVVLSRLLAVPPSAPLVRLVCLGLGNDEPLAIYRTYVSATELGDAVRAFRRAIAAGAPPPMVSELYARQRGLPGLRAEQTFETRVADADELALLSLRAPAAVFHVTSLISTPEGEPVEYRRAVYRGDRYTFNIERRLQFTGASTREGRP